MSDSLPIPPSGPQTPPGPKHKAGPGRPPGMRNRPKPPGVDPTNHQRALLSYERRVAVALVKACEEAACGVTTAPPEEQALRLAMLRTLTGTLTALSKALSAHWQYVEIGEDLDDVPFVPPAEVAPQSAQERLRAMTEGASDAT